MTVAIWYLHGKHHGAVLPPTLDVGQSFLNAELPLFKFGPQVPFDTAAGMVMQEAIGNLTWHFPNFTKTVVVRQLVGFLHPDEVLGIFRALPPTFSTDADTVDLMPSFEYYVEVKGGGNPPVPAQLREIYKRVTEERLLPYIRVRYGCPQCRVCTSLVRRYRSGERTQHPPHYDSHAFITVVVSLTERNAHFRGGMYVRTNPGTEKFIPGSLGEAIMHQHDLEHGVWVQQGIRYSWIFWVQDSSKCSGAHEGWHKTSAQLGDPIAQYNLHAVLDKLPGRKKAGLAWLRKAAQHGYANAQHKFGYAYIFGDGVLQNVTTGLRWYHKAAAQNFTLSAYAIGRMLEAGFGSPSDAAAAAMWYRRCLSASPFGQNVDALNSLAKLLSHGSVEPQGTENAITLWKQAADEGGSIEASLKLAMHYDMDEQADAEAQKWYARASALGDTNATSKLRSPWEFNTAVLFVSRLFRCCYMHGEQLALAIRLGLGKLCARKHAKVNSLA